MTHIGHLVCPRCRRTFMEKRRCPSDGAFLVTPEVVAETGRDPYIGAFISERYGIIKRLGVGGMGAVYQAFDEQDHGKSVAIKFLRQQYTRHPSIRQRFIREAEAALAVESPYVVPLVDFGVEEDRTLWLVMDYVKGWTLRDEVNHHGPFNVKDITEVARQTLLGLAAAHDVGLVHRDLKHDNVMFSGSRPDDFICRVLDFGVVSSSVADSELAKGAGKLTGAGVMVGSPSYMAPEQIRGLEVGPPADLYALAVVVYEAVTARRLFSVNNYEALVRAGARRDAPPLRFTGAGEPIPEAFDRIIRRALAHDPVDRFPDARTMLLALDQMDVARAPSNLLSDATEEGDSSVETARTASDRAPTTPISNIIRDAARTPSLLADPANLVVQDTVADDLEFDLAMATPSPLPALPAPTLVPRPPPAPSAQDPWWLRHVTFAGAATIAWTLTRVLLS
jgi:serine/threonine protein kinase